MKILELLHDKDFEFEDAKKGLGNISSIEHCGYFVLVDSSKLKSDMKFNEENSKIYTYLVMPRLGMNLLDLLRARDINYTEESIFSLGIQLLNILEKVHSAGFVFNDLKLDNLLLDFDADVSKLKEDFVNDIFATNNINLIDFGFATTYL